MIRLQSLTCLLIGATTCLAAERAVRLENDRLAIQLDGRTGGLTAIEDKLGKVTYGVTDASFRIEVGTGDTPGTHGFLTPERCQLKEITSTATEARYVFEMTPFTLTLLWGIDPGDDFAVKRARVEYSGSGKFNVRRFEMFDWALTPRPLKAIPYYGFLRPSVTRNLDDGEEPLPSDTSTAFFFRYADRGVFSALTCDFVLMKTDAASGRHRSTCWPGFILDDGQALESEGGIVGVYPRKGMFHEPFQPSSELRHFHFANVDTRLDRGEIEAVSAATRKFLKPGVYRTLVNGWGVGLPWLIETEEATQQYRHAIDTLLKIPAIEALHFVHSWCGLAREFRDQGLAVPLRPNPHADAVFQYAREKGLGLSMFIGISNNYPMHREGPSLNASTELLSMEKNGQRRPNNIAISRQYADFIFNTVSGMVDRYPVVGLSYDFLGIQPDYDPAHGYLPGRASLLPQYANVRAVNRRLRECFPNLMFRGQIGWMWFGPWLGENMSLCHNASDHNLPMQRNFLDCHADYHFANNIRLSNWFTNNCKMHPRHKMNSNSIHNGSKFRAWDYGAWRYSILSQIATGDVFGMLHNLPDEQKGEVFRQEDGEFFKKWIDWQKAHRGYYLRENDLFGEPRPTGLDGYAYGSGRDSVVFICNPTFKTHSAAVPIDTETHLPAGTAYRVKELYPQERYHIGPQAGVFPYGSTFVTDVPPQTVTVLEIMPDNPDEPLLLSVQGQLTAVKRDTHRSGDSEPIYDLTRLAGPAGRSGELAVRLPRALQGPAQLTLDGKPLPATRVGRLLLARVRFGGESIDPEVRNWKARREGERLKIRADILVPESARTVLQSQKLPISSAYDTDEWRNRTAWLGAHRFIVHVPILPSGFQADSLLGKKIKELESRTKPEATFNGRPVPVRSNLMGGLDAARWSGFFVDATDLVQYGKANVLELDLFRSPEENCLGLYLPNLTPQISSHVTPLEPPAGLAFVPAAEATDALPAVPMIRQDRERLTLWLRLKLTARNPVVWNPREVKVEDGRFASQVVLGADPRWTIPAEAVARGGVQLGSKPKELLLQVEGTRQTRIQLGSQPEDPSFTLGEVHDAWLRRGDKYDSHATRIDWPGKKGTIDVEIGAPWDHKGASQWQR